MHIQWLAVILFATAISLAFFLLFRTTKIFRYWQRKNTAVTYDWLGVRCRGRRHHIIYFLLLNLIAALALLGVATLALLIGLPFAAWSGAVAIIVWCFILMQKVLSWQTHNHHHD